MQQLLGIRPGVTAIIGSGGKTTLMMALARRLPGRRIICTTTRIYRPTELPVCSGADSAAIRAILAQYGCICVGEDVPQGKLMMPQCGVQVLAELADYVLVEADGAKHLPLKAHLPGEPAIPDCADRVLLVAGLHGLGLPVEQAAHRPERFAQLAQIGLQTLVDAPALARVLRAEALADAVILNRHGGALPDDERRLASLLSVPVFAGDLSQEELSPI